MLVVVYFFLTIAVAYAVGAIWVTATTSIALLLGVKVVGIHVGYGFSFFTYRWKVHGCDLTLGLLVPFHASARFWTKPEDSGPSDSESAVAAVESETENVSKSTRWRYYNDLTIFLRGMITLAGPVSILVPGLILLFLPVHLGWNQLAVNPDLPLKIVPSSVPELGINTQSATWQGQIDLINSTLIAFPTRLFSGRSMEGWGGPLSWLATSGFAAAQEPRVWCSCIALLFMGTGLYDLLPLPPSAGGRLMFLFFEWFCGGVGEKWEFRSTLTVTLLMLLLYAYLLFRDLFWFGCLILGAF